MQRHVAGKFVLLTKPKGTFDGPDRPSSNFMETIVSGQFLKTWLPLLAVSYLSISLLGGSMAIADETAQQVTSIEGITEYVGAEPGWRSFG